MKCREFGITCVRERERELGVGRMELSYGHTADVNVVNFMCH